MWREQPLRRPTTVGHPLRARAARHESLPHDIDDRGRPPTTTGPSTTTTAPFTCPPRPPRVIIYGDSIARETQNAFRFWIPGVDVLTRISGGTAICDWFRFMQHDAAPFPPDVVVAGFAGVDWTPCIKVRAPIGFSPANIAAFRTDAIKATAILWAYGAEVIWVGSAVGQHNPDLSLQHRYASLPGFVPHAACVLAGAAVAPGDVYTWTMPCLLNEPTCTDGLVTVRNPDGVHFCPVFTRLICPVWSGGALRFGQAMAQAALN